jgi:hypothetical protein
MKPCRGTAQHLLQHVARAGGRHGGKLIVRGGRGRARARPRRVQLGRAHAQEGGQLAQVVQPGAAQARVRDQARDQACRGGGPGALHACDAQLARAGALLIGSLRDMAAQQGLRTKK